MYKTDELKGKIVANGFNIKSFAETIGLSRQSLGAKLRGKTSFTVAEIEKICDVLSISKSEIADYFFTK